MSAVINYLHTIYSIYTTYATYLHLCLPTYEGTLQAPSWRTVRVQSCLRLFTYMVCVGKVLGRKEARKEKGRTELPIFLASGLVVILLLIFDLFFFLLKEIRGGGEGKGGR